METIQKTYVPVNCAFHDYLEHFATLAEPVKIVFVDANSSKVTVIEKAIIYDLTGGRNGEYTHINFSGQKMKIRNDYLISINEINARDFDEGSNCNF